jgi:hypothetical protein
LSVGGIVSITGYFVVTIHDSIVTSVDFKCFHGQYSPNETPAPVDKNGEMNIKDIPSPAEIERKLAIEELIRRGLMKPQEAKTALAAIEAKKIRRQDSNEKENAMSNCNISEGYGSREYSDRAWNNGHKNVPIWERALLWLQFALGFLVLTLLAVGGSKWIRWIIS